MRNKTIQLNTMPNAPEDAYFLVALSFQFKGIQPSSPTSYTVSIIDPDADPIGMRWEVEVK